MPSFLCKLLICSLSLSLTFASNADKGSSRSKKSGSKAIARANATLCCCPPDNCDGYFFSYPLNSTTSRTSLTFLSILDTYVFIF